MCSHLPVLKIYKITFKKKKLYKYRHLIFYLYFDPIHGSKWHNLRKYSNYCKKIDNAWVLRIDSHTVNGPTCFYAYKMCTVIKQCVYMRCFSQKYCLKRLAPIKSHIPSIIQSRAKNKTKKTIRLIWHLQYSTSSTMLPSSGLNWEIPFLILFLVKKKCMKIVKKFKYHLVK